MAPNRTCPVCGLFLPVEAMPCPNRWCHRAGRGFSVVFSIGVYDGALKRAIGRYKFGEERRLAPVLAATVARYLTSHPAWFEEFGLITGVPAYAGSGARRPWDPVGAVLDELGPMLDAKWSVSRRLVVKTRETPAMTGRNWADRQTTAQGPLRRSLATTGVPLAGRQVLVFDDVLTEGGTLREVASVLRQAGASDVAALVLARPGWSVRAPEPGLL